MTSDLETGDLTPPKRTRWFERGARNLNSYAKRSGANDLVEITKDLNISGCPLCLDLKVLDDLTLEHVPPRSQGGGEVCLTCKDCNHSQGSQFDAHAATDTRMQDFASGNSARPVDANITIGGIRVRAERYDQPHGMIISAIQNPRANNPRDLAALQDYFNNLADTDELTVQISTQFRRAEWRANVSWVRSAYLATFAFFGWSWVLNPTLTPIREQLKDPSTERLPILSGHHDSVTRDDRRLLVVEEPSELSGIVIAQWGQQITAMPGLNATASLEKLSEALSDESREYSFTGKTHAWPLEPMHSEDENTATENATIEAESD